MKIGFERFSNFIPTNRLQINLNLDEVQGKFEFEIRRKYSKLTV